MTVTPDDAVMTLAGDFPSVSPHRWAELVAGVVNKSRAEEAHLDPEAAVASLTTTLEDGIVVQPLYQGGRTALGLPGAMPFTRGSGPRHPDQPWDMRQLFEGQDAEQVRRDVLVDLERGVTSLWIAVGDGYLGASDLAAALDGVLLDLAPVAVSSVGEQAEAAAALLTVLEGAETVAAGSSLGLDPIGAAARTGGSVDLAGLDTVVRRAAALTGLSAITVDSRVYHDAGATDVEEIALAVATGVAYVRALEEAGLTAEQAFATIDFRVSATADQFSTIAALRVLRRLWARVGELAGVPEEVRAARIHAVTSERMLTATDPWVNVLRGTLACFAASAGGADRITVLPYDTPLGLPEPFSRRLARNTQGLLAFESHVAAVADPAGGSYYVESLTDEMAQRAWARLGEIDAAGGVASMLADGSLAASLQGMWTQRLAGLSSRAIPLTGTSTFPLAGEQPLPRTPRPPAPTGGLPRHRDGEVFEQLRARAQGVQEPTVLLVSPGTRRDFGARQTFAANLLAVGGITARLVEEVDAAGAGEAARESGLRVAVLATSPKVNATLGADVVAALRDAGVDHVVIAGRASELGEGEGADRLDVAEAREGVDVVALLSDLLDRLGAEDDTAATTVSEGELR